MSSNIIVTYLQCITVFALVILGLELRALHLLGKWYTTVLKCFLRYFTDYGSDTNYNISLGYGQVFLTL
jgi:hypothetical protein